MILSANSDYFLNSVNKLIFAMVKCCVFFRNGLNYKKRSARSANAGNHRGDLGDRGDMNDPGDLGDRGDLATMVPVATKATVATHATVVLERAWRFVQ
jgi:hypothetical protein